MINGMRIAITNPPGQNGEAQQAIKHAHGERAPHDEQYGKSGAVIDHGRQRIPIKQWNLVPPLHEPPAE